MMESILITSEMFNIGGLESHVTGEVTGLTREGYRVHLVTGAGSNLEMLPTEAASVVVGPAMGPATTMSDLIGTVEHLRKIIRKEAVACVHAHPFTSFVPSQIAAELEGVPLVITLHGPASLSESYGPLYDFLLKSVILRDAALVASVSREVAYLAAPYVDGDRLCVFPNSVNVEEFYSAGVGENSDGRCLLVSRLDVHKIVGIRDFIRKSAVAGLPGILLAGDGEAREDLRSQLRVDGLIDYVEFVGATKEVPTLMRRAAGVAGMGRVVLEGLACRKPVMLVGYDGIKGYVTDEIFSTISARNFSGRTMPSIDAEEFSRRVARFGHGSDKLADRVATEYSDKVVWREFAHRVRGLRSHGRSLLADAYVRITSEAYTPTETYLQSPLFVEALSRLVYSPRHFDQCVAFNFSRVKKRDAVNDLTARIDHLNSVIANKGSEIANLTQAVKERDGQIWNFKQVVMERDRQLTQVKNVAEFQSVRLEQLLHSRSWRLTQPFRAATRIMKSKIFFGNLNREIYDFAVRVGHKLPLPQGVKTRVRNALSERLLSHGVPVEHHSKRSRMPVDKLRHSSGSCTAMRPECCGAADGLVSVVLPVYNQGNLISESIESVLNQTYPNFELIIINDGSSDGVETVLERYVDHPKIRCFAQTNQGLPKALSNGFTFARGEFWTWTSADNIMEPRMLEVLVDKLRIEPSVGMVFGDYYAIDDHGGLLHDFTWRAHNRPNPASGEIRLPHSTEALNTVQDNFIGPCFMYRGWVGRCLGDYDPQLGVEDYDYWMRINALFSIDHVGDDSLLYRYRVHENTLSAKAREHKILEKVQRLMACERERAAYYSKPLTYVTDREGRSWLLARGITKHNISAGGKDFDSGTLTIMSCESAEAVVSELLSSVRPVAIIMSQLNFRYHKLARLFNSGNCIVLAEDRKSAERIRLLSSSCPVVDAKSKMALRAIQAFAKNLLFVRATRRKEEMKREMPSRVMGSRSYHVVLQVDSFTQGGMENVVIDLALSLISSRYQVTIVNFGRGGDAGAKALERGLLVVSLPADLSEEAYGSWLAEKGVDLVNAHYSIRGAAACADFGRPFIQTIHNSYVWLDPGRIEQLRVADRYTTEYICVSMTAARYADVALGLDVGKMHVVSNGIDPSTINAANFDTNRASLRRTWDVGTEVPVFLNVASIMAAKAQLPLVRAFARVVEEVPEARLVLLGGVMETSYKARIEETLRDLGLQKSVLFAGYDRDVSRYYHAADVFVLPSYWEGWSLSLGEAMANGLACVITDVGSAYEFEGCDGVEIVEPPFVDIVQLTYRNLGSFLSGADGAFEDRLARSMIKVSSHRRASVNTLLAQQIDRNIAYMKYSEMFAEKIVERGPMKLEVEVRSESALNRPWVAGVHVNTDKGETAEKRPDQPSSGRLEVDEKRGS